MKPTIKFSENFAYYLRKFLFTYIFGATVFLNAYLMFANSGIFYCVYNFDLLMLLQETFSGGWSGYFTPALIALPYVIRFHEEKGSGAYRFGLIRAGKLKYVSCMVRDAALSGVLVMACSLILFVAEVWIYAILQGGRITLSAFGMFGNEYEPTFYYELIVNGKGFAAFLVNCFFLLGWGVFWSCIGTVISFFVKNKRIAVAGSFIFKRFFDYITPDSMYFLEPANLQLSPYAQAMYLGGIPYAICYVGITFVLSIAVLYFGMEVWLWKHG